MVVFYISICLFHYWRRKLGYGVITGLAKVILVATSGARRAASGGQALNAPLVGKFLVVNPVV